MNIQPIEVPERYIHVFPAKLLSGGHPNQKRTFLGGGGGAALTNSVVGECWSQNNLQI